MRIPSSVPPAVPTSEKRSGFLPRHPLLGYFVLAYGLSWLFWLPYVLSLDGLGILPVHLTQLGILPGLYLGPLLSSFLMTAATEGRSGVARLLRRFVQWSVGLQWYLVTLVGIPAIIVIGFIMQPGAVAALHPVLPQLFLLFPPLLLLEIFTSGLAEEPGWRGFALPRLQHYYGPLLGSLILGILWQCWHLPLYLTSWGNGSGWLEIGESIVSSIGITILITWVFNHARASLLITILMHAAIDAFGADAATSLFSTGWMFKHSYIALLTGFGIVAVILVIVSRGRLGYRRATVSSEVTTLLNTERS